MYKKFDNLDDVTSNFDFTNIQVSDNSINEDSLYPCIDNLINIFVENYYYAFIEPKFNDYLLNNIYNIINPILSEVIISNEILFNINDLKYI